MTPLEHHKCFSYCLSIGIRIYPKPVFSDGSVVKIAIENNGTEKVGNEQYDGKKVHLKIHQLLETIYKKSNNTENDK